MLEIVMNRARNITDNNYMNLKLIEILPTVILSVFYSLHTIV